MKLIQLFEMKKIDIIISLITGEGVAWLFVWLLKGSTVQLPFLSWLLPISFPFLSLFCLWISYLIGKKYIVVFQLAKFLLIGALFALFDLVILNGLMQWFGVTLETRIKYSIFVGISFVIATSIKYIADKYWAFEKKEGSKVGIEFTGFFIVTLISGGIQVGIASIIFYLINPMYGMSILAWANVGKILGIVAASAWNFLGYKFFVFKK